MSYEKHLFIYTDNLPKGHSRYTVLNTVQMLLSSDVSLASVRSVDAGFEKRPAIRITFVMEGDDPDYYAGED